MNTCLLTCLQHAAYLPVQCAMMVNRYIMQVAPVEQPMYAAPLLPLPCLQACHMHTAASGFCIAHEAGVRHQDDVCNQARGICGAAVSSDVAMPVLLGIGPSWHMLTLHGPLKQPAQSCYHGILEHLHSIHPLLRQCAPLEKHMQTKSP
jgi:hypothetical protein